MSEDGIRPTSKKAPYDYLCACRVLPVDPGWRRKRQSSVGLPTKSSSCNVNLPPTHWPIPSTLRNGKTFRLAKLPSYGEHAVSERFPACVHFQRRHSSKIKFTSQPAMSAQIIPACRPGNSEEPRTGGWREPNSFGPRRRTTVRCVGCRESCGNVRSGVTT